MESLKRRDFLGLSLALAGSLKAADPHWSFPTAARDRLSVSTYPFRRLIATPHADGEETASSGMPLEQFAHTIVPDFGVPGIEPWSHHFKSTEAAYVGRLKKQFTAAGVHVVNIPVDIDARLCGTQEQREAGLAAYRKWVDAAVILHSPSIRVHLPRGESGSEISCSVTGLKALAAYGESKGIVINVENDEPAIEMPERIVRVLKAVDSPYLRSLPDFCNSMLVHNDENYNNQALSTLFPLAYNISHVKDFEQDKQTVYRVNVEHILAIAKEAGYIGYFSMEWDSEGDPYPGTRELIATCLKALA